MTVDGSTYCFTKEGRSMGAVDHYLDLFMAPQKKEYWINVYRKDDGGIYTSTFAYGSEREAKDNKGGGECISQVKVWEEMI